MTFKELGLRSEILNVLTEIGFEQPTPIQEEAIPQLLAEKRDLVGLAQTGTGKTAAFGLPLLNMVDFGDPKVQALVIAPTRELCLQIASDFKIFSKQINGAKVATIYGGASIDTQAREIKRGAQVVVATPGRLIDMIKRRLLKLSDVQIVVLDEADEMLNMGFKEDIDNILDQTPEGKSVWLFSATMPKMVSKIASRYMTNPIEVTVGTKNSSNQNIKHEYYCVNHRDRYYALKRVLDFNPEIYGVIFCRTKRETQEVADKLMRDGYSAEPIHGDLTQMGRDKVMGKFRDKAIQILVATDVAARGIDVQDITHVINYNLPDEIESYTHRSGRTARAGKEGVSLIFVTNKEVYKIKQIEKVIQRSFTLEKVPSGEEICKNQLFSLIQDIKSTEVKEDQIAEYIPAITELFEDYSKEDLIKQFVSSEFNKFLEYYSKAGDLNATPGKDSGRDRDRGRDSGRDRDRGGDRDGGNDRDRSKGRNRNLEDSDKQRFFVNLGLESGLNKGAIVRLVCEHANVSSAEVGRIDLFNEYSFFDINKEHAASVLKGMNGVEFNDKSMSVEEASPSSGGGGGGGGSRRGGGGDRSKRRSTGGGGNSGGGGNRDRSRPRDRSRRRS